MKRLVSVNFNILEQSETTLRPTSAALLYGKSVFTTIAVRGGDPFLFDRHCGRLADHGARIGVDTAGVEFPRLETEIRRLAARNGDLDGRARITICARGGGIWGNDEGVDVIVMTTGARAVPESLTIGLSPFPVNQSSPLAGVKSGNYLEPLSAFDEAVGRGYDEAIRVNHRGEVVSGCLANLFWVKGGRIFTPPVEAGCLEGTTRGLIIDNFDVGQTMVGVESIKEADEIFLTSAGVGVASATFGGAAHGESPVTERVREFVRMFEA